MAPNDPRLVYLTPPDGIPPSSPPTGLFLLQARMIQISVRTDIKAAIAKLNRLQREQVPFATAKALTMTAKDAQSALDVAMETQLDNPTPFTKRAIGIERATKQNLTARVFIKPTQLAYLQWQVAGGTRGPKGRAIPIPQSVPLNQYGNMTRNKVKQLMARADVFSGTVRGVGGIWQRTKRGGVKLLIAWEPKATYKPRFKFYEVAKKTIRAKFSSNFQSSLAGALATAL